MAEFVEIIKQFRRMDKFYDDGIGCGLCPLSRDNNGENLLCDDFLFKHPIQAEQIIMKWAAEHPVKTNADKFKEVFEIEVPRDDDGEYADFCAMFDCVGERPCVRCKYNNFWEQEYKEVTE